MNCLHFTLFLKPEWGPWTQGLISIKAEMFIEGALLILQIRTIAIIAEGIPEALTRKLIKKADQKGVTIIGPATVSVHYSSLPQAAGSILFCCLFGGGFFFFLRQVITLVQTGLEFMIIFLLNLGIRGMIYHANRNHTSIVINNFYLIILDYLNPFSCKYIVYFEQNPGHVLPPRPSLGPSLPSTVQFLFNSHLYVYGFVYS